MLIPRIFHQIWVGPDPFPEEFARYQQTWLDHHSGWELRVWTEENLPEGARRAEVYDRSRALVERADILRLEVLWRYGGVHVDTDFECRRSIEPLIENVKIFIGLRKPGKVNGALMGAVAAHPLIDRALDELLPNPAHGYGKAAAGPEFLDKLFLGRDDVTLLDPKLFYPRTARTRETAYAIHHTSRSWKDAEELQSALRKMEKRLARAEREALQWRRECRRAEAELAQLRSRSPLQRLRKLIGFPPPLMSC